MTKKPKRPCSYPRCPNLTDGRFCEECFKKGIIVPVEEVHHIKPLSEGGNHNKNNLISLCKSCHAIIHAIYGEISME